VRDGDEERLPGWTRPASLYASAARLAPPLGPQSGALRYTRSHVSPRLQAGTFGA
jgi:hypothetical protein